MHVRIGTSTGTSQLVAIVVMVLALLSASLPVLAQTRAGASVSNVAQATATAGGAATSVTSNQVSFVVAERLDVTLARRDRSAAASGDGATLALPALLTNAGNGGEAFALLATGTAGLTIRGIAIDADGDGAYDPARDTLLADGTTPALEPGGSASLLVLVDGAGAAGPGGAVTLAARATTGSGPPDTVFAGAGDGGGDAVTGATGAEARVAIPLDPQAAAPVLLKSQSVLAPDGSTRAIRGATVTYTLQASFADARRAVRIDDPIPAGSRYVAGTLTLDGSPLTDAADGDAGGCDGTAVAVSLGDIAAPPSPTVTTRTVRFQAVLQ